uniref:Wsv026-like protein n=1 Tax=Trachysalambria curvirostris nimavirus TaxID=2984282 RepID=A0A9C7C952_9VIRU|nr:MAG: wsv026-like protein [Trachysalambria curvirostris nimavirus]
MLSDFLFMSREKAISIGTAEHVLPSFMPYESISLQSVGLSERIKFRAYPRFLPRPFDINSVQATAVRLALVQYFDSKGWKEYMTPDDLITIDLVRRGCSNNKTAGGFIIGDGTGVGKTRELAAFIVSVTLYEKAISDTQCQMGPLIFRSERSMSVIDTVRNGSWRRAPFFIWLTCSKPLFSSCQDGIREVLTNTGLNSGAQSWRPYPDSPSRFVGGGGAGSVSICTENVLSGETEETLIMFYTLRDIKNHDISGTGGRLTSDFFTGAPGILFMTYADLNANLEYVLQFISGGANIDANVRVPVDNIVTAVLCDEFHQPKNISDPFRRVLQDLWAEEDNRVLSDSPRPPNPSLSKLVGRFKSVMSRDKQFAVRCQRSRRGQKNVCRGDLSLSTRAFLSLLRMSDSFRLFLEVIKYKTFCVMASATPFQSNADLHSVDHILRKNIPAYTSIAAFSGGENYSTPDAIAENSEYSTVFLEEVVKLLKNRGQLVSRCISIANVECSVVNCNMTPMQRYAVDELSSYCLKAKQILIDSDKLGEAIADALSSCASEESGIVPGESLRELVSILNSLNTAEERPLKRKRGEIDSGLRSRLVKMDRRFRAMVLHSSDVAHDGHTSIDTILRDAARAALQKNRGSMESTVYKASESPSQSNSMGAVAEELINIVREEYENEKIEQEEESTPGAPTTNLSTAAATMAVFSQDWFTRLKRQYFINTASISVQACKGALLSIKANAVCEAVQRLRMSSESKKAVMSLEQTGDSFVSGIAGRVFCAQGDDGDNGVGTGNAQYQRCDPGPSYGVVDLGIFDSSPLANTFLTGYRLLCRAVAIATATQFRTSGGKNAYLILVPAPPPTEPLLALSGNALDTIAQRVGENNHAEITNRKLCSRITRKGMLVICPNHKTTNTNKCIDSFNNTKEVDIMLLGPKGNTGLSLHDSKYNAMTARRIHCLLDLPYNAIAFLQMIGRTHRSGQASAPHFLIFSTDSPAERRFFDSLDKRVKDSNAGTSADRYSSNSVSISCDINREQFLDRGLVLRTMGFVIRILSSDLKQTDMMDIFSKTMIAVAGGGIAFVEGLDESNSLFLEIVLLAIHITLVAIGCWRVDSIIDCPTRLIRAKDFAATLEEQTLYSVAAAASKFVFSNLCLNLVFHRGEQDLSGMLLSLSKAAGALVALACHESKQEKDRPRPQQRSCASIFPAGGRDASLDMYSDLITQRATGVPYSDHSNRSETDNHYRTSSNLCANREQSIAQVVYSSIPPDLSAAIAASDRVYTVRVLGTGHKEGVVPASQCLEAIPADVAQSIPIVAACSVLNTLSRENPGLVFDLHIAAMPHTQFNKSSRSIGYILELARKLSKGSLDYRQFQNNFFSPRSESRLVSETFTSIKAILARDDRLDGLCKVRMNSVMGASYVRVRKRPECVFISRLLDPVLRRHVALDIDEQEGDEYERICDSSRHVPEAENRYSSHDLSHVGGLGEGHDLDVILCTGITVTLTKENSAFVREHIDFFVAGNLIGRDGSILQLCFDNCNGVYDSMPKFCLYDPSYKALSSG